MSKIKRAAWGFNSDADVVMAARTMGLLYLAGATIGLLSILLPHSAAANDTALASNIVLAYAGGAALLAAGRHVRGWMVHLVLIVGVLVIGRAIYYSGEAVSFYSIWFIWIGLVAFSFFPRPVSATYVAYSSAVYALTLVNEPGSSPVSRWLTTVATLVVAGVLINALVARARRQADLASTSAQTMATVADLAHDLARQSDPAMARPALCDAALKLTGAGGVALFEPADLTGDLRISCAAGAGANEGFKGCAAHAFATGEPVVSGASLWQPVVRDKAAIAVIAFRWAFVEDRESADEDVISLLVTETSVTLERLDLMQRLEVSARTDELTGLPNRRAWEEELPRELARAEREGSSLCVAMLDIDHFKAFNDLHGHLAGDLLLKEATAAWASKLRVTDLLARFGGEEFTLAIPNCGEQEALALVERLRASMPSGVTCSAGIAAWDGAEPASALLERADQALYRAKEAGRDRGELAPT